MCTRALVLDIRITTNQPHWCLTNGFVHSCSKKSLWSWPRFGIPSSMRNLILKCLVIPWTRREITGCKLNLVQITMSGPVLWSSSQAGQNILLQLRTHLTKVWFMNKTTRHLGTLALRDWARGAAHSNSFSLLSSGMQHASSSASLLSETRLTPSEIPGKLVLYLNWKLPAESPRSKLSQNINIPKLSWDTQEKPQSWLFMNVDPEQILKLGLSDWLLCSSSSST